MPPPSSRANDAFPRGTYAKYKRATSYFLRWLLRARTNGVGVSVGASEIDTASQPLDAYEQVVHAIVEDPTSLPPVLLQGFPHALSACEVAITLRARVAVFFGDSADDAHAHFLARLQSWFESLSSVLAAPCDSASPTEADEKNAHDFSNYYAVLALPDDYFADDDNHRDTPSTALCVEIPRLSKVDRKRLQEEAFADDFNTELACLFMELDELSEAVYATFLDVKRERKTLVEATVVTKVAIDSAASVIAHFQLRYPSLRDGIDLSTLIQDRLSLDQITRLVGTVQTAWMPSKDLSEIRHQYVAGTVLIDIVGIVSILATMAPGMPRRVGPVGPRYDEATTRHFVVPEWGHPPQFFMHHLPQLLNICVDIQELDFTVASTSLDAWLLEPFHKFSTTGSVSIHLVFSCVCWIRSIAALQGDRTLARTMSLSLMHTWRLQQRLAASMVTNGGRGHYHEYVKGLHRKIEALDYVSAHMRVHPLFAGCVMLDQHLRYLTLGNDALLSSLFRPFCHVYSALRDRRVVDAIPFIENAIDVYEAAVFTPSRAAATHGCFAKSFLSSHTLVEATVEVRLHRNKRAPPRPGQAKSIVEKGRMPYLSHVVRLLDANDFSVLPTASSVSWTAFLSAVSTLCHRELFGSRVLSRDALKLSDDLTDVFYSLCDALDRRAQLERMNPRTITRHRALENVVVFTLLPLLDALTDADWTRSTCSSLDVCRRAAAVITREFGDATQVEKDYFTFYPTPAWLTIEFPRLPSSETLSRTSTSDAAEFNALLEILKTSHGPLRGEELEEFKRRVLATPGVLAQVCPLPTTELWSLLHQAACGPARDLLLAEWLMQMGALAGEPTSCRHPELVDRLTLPERFTPAMLPNALAVHCAAKKGYRKMVKVIVEAGNFQDLDTRTFQTKESLVQIAVQVDDQDLFAWLMYHSARCSGADAAGKHAWDFTSDRRWRATLKQVAAMERAEDEENAKNADDDDEYRRSPATLERTAQHAQRLQSAALANQHQLPPVSFEHTRPTSSAPCESNILGVSKGKKNKKKRKKATTSNTQPSAEDTTTHLMGQLFVADNADRSHDKVDVLAVELEKLEADAFGSQADRENCVIRVFQIYSHFSEAVENVVMAGILSKSAAVQKEVRDAGRAVLLLHDFQPHLMQKAATDKENGDSILMASLRALLTPAGETRTFELFFLVMMKSAALLGYCDLVQLRDKVFAAMERNLFWVPDRSFGFREMVSHYIIARTMGNPSAGIASTHAAQRQLEWYATDDWLEDKDDLDRLDCLYGCHHYFRLQIVGGLESPAFDACVVAIDEQMPHERDAVYADDCLIVGAQTKSQLQDILEVVLAAAKQTGAAFQYGEEDLDLKSVEIMGFEFSATGIVRKLP